MTELLRTAAADADRNLRWLTENVPSLFSGALRQDDQALAGLVSGLSRLRRDRRVVVADRDEELILARLDVPGSVFETLQQIQDRAISYAEISHSIAPLPGTTQLLELHHYRFEPQGGAAAAPAVAPGVARDVADRVREAMDDDHPIPGAAFDELLRVAWTSNARWVALAPARQVAQLLWVLHESRQRGGFFLSCEQPGGATNPEESTVLFAVESPPRRGYLMQIIEVFNGLDIGVRRCTTVDVETDAHPVFLGIFELAHRKGAPLNDPELLNRLRTLLYNTRILATDSPLYRDLVVSGVMAGNEAALVNAFIGFCHANCAHNQPHRYTLEDVVRAFHSHPDIALRLVRLFEARFDPGNSPHAEHYEVALADVERELASYNTGHRRLDDFRRSVFQTALTFVRRTLKTNFFVPEKGALAFRLDPAYLTDLGPEFTADLPPALPFRVTYFCGRHAIGFHVGFADIARGGWRTLVTKTRDDYVTVANRVFHETYVLAHTQNLKNKDIYEGGSKMVVVIQAPDVETREQMNRRLHEVQLAFASAFLDIFVTRDGKAKDPRVVDFYGEDEPIELGPDENMHDEMIEAIAALSYRRGYGLGAGIMSSKKVGINHKQYGVTSTGLVTFAEVAMRERGVDMRRDRFSVKLTGGPNGDVAGNALRLLLARCPGVEIRLVLDGTGAIYDPRGIDRDALAGIVLRADADAFDASALSRGGFVLHRNVRRTEGLRVLHRRLARTESGLEESWVTVDELNVLLDELLFTVEADLFIPAGGRPETIDATNWRLLLTDAGAPRVPLIVEGANSFITPEARNHLQKAGVVILRDASANKCGVISSSYEIIANLLLSDEEFLAHREEYVRDVLAILERRAADEAHLIFRRHREAAGTKSFTEISDSISEEINANKARLYAFFEENPALFEDPRFRPALMAHLPRIVRETPEFRGRVSRLPSKYRSAIMAAEIATTMAYRRPMEPDFREMLERYVAVMFGEASRPG
jgi:glutamate dehydrogenase